jgi:hypothetical protein
VTPQVSQCRGLWRRTLLIDTDGSRDTTTQVLWLQGVSAFVDLRGPGAGFAGRLSQRDDIFEWTRTIDLQPAGPPDAGRMSWEGDTLVEVGVHADYIEHWQRETEPLEPCWGLLMSGPDDAVAILVRVGGRFGWAVKSPACEEISLGVVNGTNWLITDSAHCGRVGMALLPRLVSGQLRVDDDFAWSVEEREGSVTL